MSEVRNNSVVHIRDAVGSRLAFEFLKRKIALIKITPHSKKPVEKEWTTKYYTDVNAASVFTDYNIGMILGRSSGGLTDIDLDCPEAVKLAPKILPGTTWVFGRRSAPRSHYMYTVRESRTTKFASPLKDGGMLLEIRSDGAQTVGPGSIHPSGESINFYDESWRQFPPRELPLQELQQRVGDLAAAVLVLRHGWSDGKRDELAVALCGLMLRMKRDPDYIDDWLGSIAEAAGDEELDMRLKAEYQAKRLEKNERVPGIPSLLNILGQDIGTRVIDWLGVRSLNLVHQLNQEIAVINMGGRTKILLDGGYWSLNEPQFLKVSDARDMFRYKGEVIEEKKKPKLKFDIWLHAEERRNYIRMVFSPDGCKDMEYNLWKGWPIAENPDKSGCKLFLDHVREIICAGNEDLYDYLINWLADSIQNPTVRPGVALVLQGGQGIGKTIFASYVLKMYGRYGSVSTNTNHLFGKHNFHLANKLMVFADESCWAGNHQQEKVLQNMITGDHLTYEPKGVDAFQMENFLRLIMATNDAWAVPASGNARRFCILEVSGHKKDDFDYFDSLKFEMENEGPEALLYYLKNYKIDRNLRKLPETLAITRNKILTAANSNPILGWWIQRLMEGIQVKGLTDWGEFISLDRLYRDYFQFHGNSRNDRGNQTSFGMLFRSLLPPGTVISKKRVEGILKRGYRFPALDQCKQFVCDEIKEPKLFDRDWGI